MRVKDVSKGPAGPLLDRPTVVLPDVHPLSSFGFYALLLLLGGGGAMACFLTAFQFPVDLAPVAVIHVLCVTVCTAQFFLPRQGWLLCLVSAVVWGFFLWNCFDDGVEGFMRLVNAVSEAYSEKLNFTLPIFLHLEMVFPDRERYLETLFVMLAQFPYVWLLSWALVYFRSALFSFCLTGALLLFPLAFSILPAAWSLVCLGVFWMFLLLSLPALRQRRYLSEERGRFQAAGVGFIRVSTLGLVFLLLLCMWAARLICPPETYERPKVADRVRSTVAEAAGLAPLFKGGGSGFGQSRVDLAALGDREYTGETALRARRDWQMDPPEEDALEALFNGHKDYLKGFVGSVYTGTSWETLSEDSAAQAADALGKRKAQTFPADYSQIMPSWKLDAAYPYILTVEAVHAEKGRVFSPYGLYSPTGPPADTEYADDGFLKPDGLFASDEFVFSTVALPGEEMLLGASYSSRALLGSMPVRYMFAGEEGTSDTLILQEDGNPSPSLDPGPEDAPLGGGEDLARIAGDSKAGLKESVREMAEAAEAYNAFVYEEYTRLPDRLRTYLDGYTQEKGMAPQDFENSYSGRFSYIKKVKKVLEEECVYTLSPPSLPQGRDFVEYFLSESQRGYCVHFATAAVALLRYAGIPARYAEGYVVPLEADGAWVSVPDSNAHAWAEVWVGGEGWMPVEMTPASPEAPGAYAEGRLPETESSPSPSDSPSPEDTPSPSPSPASAPESGAPETSPTPAASAAPEGPGSDQNGGNSGGSLLAAVLLISAGAAASLFLLMEAARRIRLYRRKREFSQRDRSRAALCVYAHLLRLYRAGRGLEGWETVPPQELRELALKARFSNHPLTHEELDAFTSLAAALEGRLKEELPLAARLRCKYLLALF